MSRRSILHGPKRPLTSQVISSAYQRRVWDAVVGWCQYMEDRPLPFPESIAMARYGQVPVDGLFFYFWVER